MLLLRQLFAVAGGGPETDAFKHLAAAFTVLRSLGSAKTATNSESSRIVSVCLGGRNDIFCNFYPSELRNNFLSIPGEFFLIVYNFFSIF